MARAAFIGSQSLRKLELDGRREVGVIITDSRIAKKVASVFEADWAQAAGAAKAAQKEKEGQGEGRYSGFRRWMTPESTTAPVRAITLK